MEPSVWVSSIVEAAITIGGDGSSSIG